MFLVQTTNLDTPAQVILNPCRAPTAAVAQLTGLALQGCRTFPNIEMIIRRGSELQLDTIVRRIIAHHIEYPEATTSFSIARSCTLSNLAQSALHGVTSPLPSDSDAERFLFRPGLPLVP